MNRHSSTRWRSAALSFAVGIALMVGESPGGALEERGRPFRFHECTPFVDDTAYTVCQDIVVLSRVVETPADNASVVYHLTVEYTVSNQDEVVFWEKTTRKEHWLYKDADLHEYSVQDRRTFEHSDERFCVTFQFHYANSQEQFFRADKCS